MTADRSEFWRLVFHGILLQDELTRISAGYYFDKATFTHKVHTVREVSPGEEISISCKTSRPEGCGTELTLSARH